MNKSEKDKQLELALKNEGKHWQEEAYIGFLKFLLGLKKREFLMEEFTKHLDDFSVNEPKKYQSIGAFTNAMAGCGLIEWTGEYRDSVSTKRTGHQLKVWRKA